MTPDEQTLAAQLDASQKLYNVGFYKGAGAGVLAGLEEACKAYRERTHAEFAFWVRDTEAAIALEHEHAEDQS
jgi:hypothetical protein